MKKLEYIPGDFTTWLGRKVRIDGVIVDPNTKRIDYYEIADTGSKSVFSGEDLKPIKLTRTILKKNGWKKFKRPYSSDYCYRRKDYPTLNIRSEKEVYFHWGGRNKSITAVHQLQHLLFGLVLNHEMEVQE